jgi:hypothetical protein
MCGWKNEFIEEYLEKDPDVLHKWQHFTELIGLE